MLSAYQRSHASGNHSRARGLFGRLQEPALPARIPSVRPALPSSKTSDSLERNLQRRLCLGKPRAIDRNSAARFQSLSLHPRRLPGFLRRIPRRPPPHSNQKGPNDFSVVQPRRESKCSSCPRSVGGVSPARRTRARFFVRSVSLFGDGSHGRDGASAGQAGDLILRRRPWTRARRPVGSQALSPAVTSYRAVIRRMT